MTDNYDRRAARLGGSNNKIAAVGNLANGARSGTDLGHGESLNGVYNY